jgi:hypothetical protein
LNRGLREALGRRLETEHYLRDLDKILDDAAKDFDDIKKDFDGIQDEYFRVPGLRADPRRGFEANRLLLTKYLLL